MNDIKKLIGGKLKKIERNESWESSPTKLFKEIGLTYRHKEYGHRDNATDGEIHVIYYIGFGDLTHILEIRSDCYCNTNTMKEDIMKSDIKEIDKNETERLKKDYEILKKKFENN